MIAMAIALIIPVALGWPITKLADKYFDWYYTRQYNQRRAKYPELFEMSETFAEYNKQRWNYLETHVKEVKRKIDKLLAEIPYLSAGQKEKAEKELEELRNQYCIAKGEYTDLEDIWLGMRKKIDKYLEEHPEIDWWN